LALTPTPSGEYAAICPNHGDTNPSLYINEEKGKFVCFGCRGRAGVLSGGGANELVQFLTGMERSQADEWLHERFEFSAVMEVLRTVLSRKLEDEDHRPYALAALLRVYSPDLPPKSLFYDFL
jgi:DNA primase